MVLCTLFQLLNATNLKYFWRKTKLDWIVSKLKKFLFRFRFEPAAYIRIDYSEMPGSKRQKKHYTDPSNQSSSQSFNKSFENLSSDSFAASPSKTKRKRVQVPNRLRKASGVDKEEMAKHVLWRRPFTTTYYFVLELFEILFSYFFKILKYRKTVVTLLLFVGLIVMSFNIPGTHLAVLYYLRKKILWCAYWLGLGVASSIGLGTGLHTFLLYLGPFIAQVTMAAYECDSLDFPEPPYPEKVVCPLNTTSNAESGENYFSSTAAMVFYFSS